MRRRWNFDPGDLALSIVLKLIFVYIRFRCRLQKVEVPGPGESSDNTWQECCGMLCLLCVCLYLDAQSSTRFLLRSSNEEAQRRLPRCARKRPSELENKWVWRGMGRHFAKISRGKIISTTIKITSPSGREILRGGPCVLCVSTVGPSLSLSTPPSIHTTSTKSLGFGSAERERERDRHMVSISASLCVEHLA